MMLFDPALAAEPLLDVVRGARIGTPRRAMPSPCARASNWSSVPTTNLPLLMLHAPGALILTSELDQSWAPLAVRRSA